MKGSSWILLMTGVLVMAGCHHDTEPPPDRTDPFAGEPAVHPAQQFAAAQAATGAREDGTLRAAHFDGGHLNSLGQQKLALMVRDDDAAGPMVVYLDLPSNTAAPKARQSVVEFLKSQGLPEAQIRVEDGPNPAVTSPAARSIEHLHRMSEEKKDQQADSNGYGPSASSPGTGIKDMSNH